MSHDVVIAAAALLGSRDVAGAVRYVQENEHLLTEDLRLPAMLQAFYAATVGGMLEAARALAARIAQDEPNMPSIQRYL